MYEGAETIITERMSRDERLRVMAYNHFLAGRFHEAMTRGARNHSNRAPDRGAMVALALQTTAKKPQLLTSIDSSSAAFEATRSSDVCDCVRQGRPGRLGVDVAFVGYRRDPWPWPIAMAMRSIRQGSSPRTGNAPGHPRRTVRTVRVRMFDETRTELLTSFALAHEPDDSCADTLRPIDPTCRGSSQP